MDSILSQTTGTTPTRSVAFTIEGEPRSKQRPRVARGRAYTPKETVEAYWAASEHLFEERVVVSIDFFNGNRRRRDIDNMVKLILDALNGVAFVDDVQVVGLEAHKFQTVKERARTEVVLTEVVIWHDERETVPEVSGP